MDWEKWCLRLSAGVIVLAVFFRVLGNGGAQAVVAKFAQTKTASVLLFMETGRILSSAPTQPQPEQAPDLSEESTLQETQAPAPEDIPNETQKPAPQQTQPVSFGAKDATLVDINSVCGYPADLPALLQTPLSWDLTAQEPTVLIVHSHGTESYKKTEDYTESSAYRTKNTDYNVVSVGAEIKRVLEDGGISVIHDTTCHDSPSYSDAYANSRKSIKDYLAQYPSIQMVLDIHRDSVENSSGKQVRYTVKAGEETAAKLMLVVGSDANGLNHPQWPENMALAVKLHAQLEKNTPGICRPISFRKQRFNQDLSTGAILVEVGSAGNSRQEALAAARLLAQSILALSAGTT